jgi:NAD(P)-dependent dehydrogenase (short-subunit alcohol dehydrogenase family)
MARIFISGSSEGLGLMAGTILAKQGHEVVLHARNDSRADDARRALPAASNVVVGDVSTLAGMSAVAEGANATGAFDAVIHNVAIGYQEPKRVETTDGLERVFATNVLAPYVLTMAMSRAKRLIYLSSGLHRSGQIGLSDLQWSNRRWNGTQAYSDSKLYDVLLAFAFARRWPDVFSNALEPGWVATRMGGPGAPDDLKLSPVTQAWLAVSNDPEATVSGCYFYHQKPQATHPAVHDVALQDELIEVCAKLSGL